MCWSVKDQRLQPDTNRNKSSVVSADRLCELLENGEAVRNFVEMCIEKCSKVKNLRQDLCENPENEHFEKRYLLLLIAAAYLRYRVSGRKGNFQKWCASAVGIKDWLKEWRGSFR